ncbi:MAG TPA: hypothetical protein VIM11_00560, partial [Tepidisphaeraceae bacterium]
MNNQALQDRLIELRRRILAIGLGASTGWGVIAGILAMAGIIWIDLALDLPSMARFGALIAVIALALIVLGRLTWMTSRTNSTEAVARRLDRLANARGQVLSGIDLLPGVLTSGAGGSVTMGMARLAVERAASIVATVQAPAAAPIGPLYRSLTVLAAIGIGALVFSISAPRLVATEWNRFADPFGDHPAYTRIEFSVTPGNAKVIYGGALDIRATTGNEQAESVEVVLQTGDESGSQEPVPMFPENGGNWHATISNVTAPVKYFVRSGKARSQKFDVEVITTPRLEAVRYRLTPPPYTHRPAIEGAIPSAGISALPGSVVQLWAQSNRPLSSGTIDFDTPQGIAPTEASTAPASTRAVQSRTFAMSPTAKDASSVSGQFVVLQSGRLNLNISDIGGQGSSDPYSVPITLLHDDRPFVRILEPQPESFATPEVTLDVQIQAEDDYGVSHLELFRGLNESRVRSTVVPVPTPEQTRVQARITLPLSEYALSPGDTVKLFARVEDNDPQGPKGFESPLVTIHIVSKEDLQKMLLARQGLETLLSKYEQASRRMEAANDQLDQLKKSLAKADPKSEVSKEFRRALQD